MQFTTSVSSEADNIASVWRYFGLEKYDVEHIDEDNLINSNYRLKYPAMTISYETFFNKTLE